MNSNSSADSIRRLCILSHMPNSTSTQKLAESVQIQFGRRMTQAKVHGKAIENLAGSLSPNKGRLLQVEIANPFCDLSYFDHSNTIFWPRLGDWQFEKSIEKLQNFEMKFPSLRWINKPSSLALAKNKLQLQLDLQKRLPFPSLFAESEAIFPVVAKLDNSSQGRGVHLIKSANELADFKKTDLKQKMFLQEYISDCDDCDYRVLVLGAKVIGVMKRQNPKDFRKNISLGGTGSKAELPDKILQLALEAHRHCGLDFSGVDLILSKKQGPLLLEVNGSCGLNGYENFVDPEIYEKISFWISEMTFFR